MASEEVRKKWGTIFMGEREASVEQLNAMQEHLNRDKLQKERTEDYMERVKARAADRAREILGAAYEERQKVLEEAKNDAAVQKRLAAQECVRIKAEGEEIRQKALEELAAAQRQREEAQKLREEARSAGYEEGMNQASEELHEFRAELGQSISAVLRAIERARKNILLDWREDLAELVRAATQAGTGYVLQKEHEVIIRQLVFQALELLENRSVVSLRVNPADEETVSDLFRAARERAPELKQWVVTGDETIERGGLVADSGTGSVDFKRANFREMVEGVLSHLGLPELDREAEESLEVANLVEQEVAHLASLTPDLPSGQPEIVEPAAPVNQAPEAPAPEVQVQDEQPVESAGEVMEEEIREAPLDAPPESGQEEEVYEQEQISADVPLAAPTLAELEDELFPLDEETPAEPDAGSEILSGHEAPPVSERTESDSGPRIDPKTLNEGGFL